MRRRRIVIDSTALRIKAVHHEVFAVRVKATPFRAQSVAYLLLCVCVCVCCNQHLSFHRRITVVVGVAPQTRSNQRRSSASAVLAGVEAFAAKRVDYVFSAGSSCPREAACSSASLKCSGNARPLFAARRRMPRHAV